MRTGTSGMNAQATRLSIVADNVANVNTCGYKAGSCEFSSLILSGYGSGYESGSVLADVRNSISAQGGLSNTSSFSDLAVSGDGFFIVANPAGSPYLTRAGSFIVNGDGTLINAGGFKLLGYKLDPDQPDITVNGYDNLTPVNVSTSSMLSSPTTSGSFKANLPSEAAIVDAAELPSLNLPESSYTAKSSLLTYDNLGATVKLDIFFAKTADNQWEVTVFDAKTASIDGSFPYSEPPLLTQNLEFGPTGKLATGQPSTVSLTVPGGAGCVLDITGLSQLATQYTVLSASVNGKPAGEPTDLEITKDGYVYAIYDSITRIPVYRIPLGHVTSPDLLTPLPGNVFTTSLDSGSVGIGFAQAGGLGSILSKTLEQSTVDLAGELTSMIDAQRGYTANSKVFQTGSELMEVLVNLKR
ncbi:MAG: flagellar hook protein FlgE [Aestuariivirga sp.]|uniref:flagellar hook protein FlgE n=1 Tax=Aestuariivirga sp. TaxID=2650926 RepID=UPI0038D16497